MTAPRPSARRVLTVAGGLFWPLFVLIFGAGLGLALLRMQQ